VEDFILACQKRGDIPVRNIIFGNSLITTTMINSGGWKDEPNRAPTIHDIRRESRRIPSGTKYS
jgi:hypothetical protein